MANRNNLVHSLWHKMQQDSVSWGSLILWVFGLMVLLLMVTMFPAV
ncbi:MAG: hypothetical protein QNJ63_13015 [Calothrix sp. MO_192.B10]|nr:hypothetical protein [Calothrix sp. MO_192.B10]